MLNHQLSEQQQKPWFAAFASFYGVNILTAVDFKLPKWHHWILSIWLSQCQPTSQIGWINGRKDRGQVSLYQEVSKCTLLWFCLGLTSQAQNTRQTWRQPGGGWGESIRSFVSGLKKIGVTTGRREGPSSAVRTRELEEDNQQKKKESFPQALDTVKD